MNKHKDVHQYLYKDEHKDEQVAYPFDDDDDEEQSIPKRRAGGEENLLRYGRKHTGEKGGHLWRSRRYWTIPVPIDEDVSFCHQTGTL